MFTLLSFTIIGFIYLLRLNKINRSFINEKSLLIIIYLLSIMSSMAMIVFYNYSLKEMVNYELGFLYLILLLLLFFYPIISFKKKSEENLLIPSKKILNPLIILMTILSYYSILYYMSSVFNVFSLNISDIASTRNNVSSGENTLLTYSKYSTIASLFVIFCVFQFFFFFILLIKKGFTIKTWLVLISTLSYPFLVLSYLGRDGFVFWLFTFISFFAFFNKYLPQHISSTIKKTLTFTIPIFFIFFMIITIGRFSSKNSLIDNDTVYSLIAYSGQGPINFAELLTFDFELTNGKTCFPFFVGSHDGIKFASNETISLLNRYDIYSWTFKTFVGSIMYDVGRFGILLLAIITSILMKTIIKHTQRGNLRLSTLLIYFTYLNIIIQGVFYFRQYTRGGNIYILLVFFIFLLFKFTETNYFKLHKK